MQATLGDLKIYEQEGSFWLSRTMRNMTREMVVNPTELRWLCAIAGPAMLNAHPEPSAEAPRFKKDPGRPFDLVVPDPIPGQEELDL